jgi:hypothetical protein
MEETNGWTDADMAHLLGERADHVKSTRFPLPAILLSNQHNAYEAMSAGYQQGSAYNTPNHNHIEGGGYQYSQAQDGPQRYGPGTPYASQGSLYQANAFAQNSRHYSTSTARFDQPPVHPLAQQTTTRTTISP